MNENTSIPATAAFNGKAILGWLFGFVALSIAFVNTFWGNDPGFGVFIALLSLVFFPPVNTFIRTKTGLSVPPIVKILLAAFIIWASLGVGELFDKIDMMIESLRAV